MFAKVFSQILDSSLAEDYRVRLVFEDLLKLADKDGIVDITKESIARRTNVPLEIVSLGITALESPDPSSRTPDHEGRRIIRLDAHRTWGWRIVNFLKYRQSATQEMLRMSAADRSKAYRNRQKGFSSDSFPKQSTEAEREAEQITPRHATVTERHAPSRPVTQNVTQDAHPSLSDVLTNAEMSGIPRNEAENFFNHFDSTGWIDKNGHPIVKWQSKLKTWWTTSQSQAAEKQHHKNGSYHPLPKKSAIDRDAEAAFLEAQRLEAM